MSGDDEPCMCGTPFTCLADAHPGFGNDTWDEADYRRDGDQALAALADSITRHDRQEGGE